MLIDGNLIPSRSTLRADVVVVGAGPAGITVATELAARHLHVVVLEAAGRHHTRADDDALDGDGSGEPFPLVRSRHRGFGGTSTHWAPATGLRVRRLDDVDFAARSWRPEHFWPFGRTALEPFYRKAYEALGLDPDDSPERWYREARPTPLAWPGGPRLAMFQFSDHDCFTRRFDEFKDSARIDLVLHASATHLELDPDGDSVTRLAVASATGRFDVTARHLVLAGGTIENARLLLASPGRDGRSIGNEHDNVGRYFMDHLSVDIGFLVPGPTDLAAGVFAEHRATGGRFQPMLWQGDGWIDREGLPNAAFWIGATDLAYASPGVSALRSLRTAYHERPRRGRMRHAAGAIVGAPGIATFAIGKVLRSKSPQMALLRILTEQVPNRRSRVRLSSRRDALGRPRVDIDWKVSGADLDGIEAHQMLLARQLGERGLATITQLFDRQSHRSPTITNYHHLGTTRMHTDPRHGVVDVDGRLHTASNVFVTGGSVFPTGGYVNPTLTIIALAYKVAAAISRDREPLFVGDARS